MTTLYTTEEILSSIYLDSENKGQVWCDLIRKLKPALRIITKNDSDYAENEESLIFSFAKDFDILPDPEYVDESDGSAILKHIIDMHKSVLSDNNSIILLDIPTEEAQNISDTYGIICHPFAIVPIVNPLFQEGIEKNVDKDEQPIGWKELFCADCEIPSNSLIFVDRYLFSKEGWITSQDGIDNVYDILNNVLPKSLGVDYHVLIVFDATTLKSTDGDTFQRISTRINTLKKRLSRPYNIIIETLSLDRNTQYYNETHNRRILSNYFLLRVDRSLKAFRENQSLYSQSLWLDWCASKGIVRQTKSDLPAKELRKYLNDIKKAVRQLKAVKGDILFSQNGNSHIPLENISNRLIK
ncbi:MAG: hypothetical protein K2L45_09455 [Muribaculaceae bacterium]|nr:hypothetical protein [Muribaculaceae bacterium]